MICVNIHTRKPGKSCSRLTGSRVHGRPRIAGYTDPPESAFTYHRESEFEPPGPRSDLLCALANLRPITRRVENRHELARLPVSSTPWYVDDFDSQQHVDVVDLGTRRRHSQGLAQRLLAVYSCGNSMSET